MADTNISNIDIKTNLHSVFPSPDVGLPSFCELVCKSHIGLRQEEVQGSGSFRIVVSASEWTYAKETCWTHAEPIWKLRAVHQKTSAKSGSNHIQSFFQPNATCCTWPALTCSYLFVEIVWNCDLKIPLLSLQFFTYPYVPLSSHSSVIQGNPLPLP